MKNITNEDYRYSTKIIDEIVDNTDISNIENKIQEKLSNYDGDKKRQFLVHLNSLFQNTLLNELTWRCNEAKDRAVEGMRVTKYLNGG